MQDHFKWVKIMQIRIFFTKLQIFTYFSKLKNISLLHLVFRVVKREEQEKIDASKPFDASPKLDLSFKEGQTIKININVSALQFSKYFHRNLLKTFWNMYRL